MNDTDLKILADQISAAEDRIVELESMVQHLGGALWRALEVIRHLDPARIEMAMHDFDRALGVDRDEEGAA
ncbi:MAG: hypothetical protein D6721_09460 [Gammaproteobacteria bacterium]|nr:MAG: hypothetical protein D6721_09460 [Gammaproteobacteria bacterium]